MKLIKLGRSYSSTQMNEAVGNINAGHQMMDQKRFYLQWRVEGPNGILHYRDEGNGNGRITFISLPYAMGVAAAKTDSYDNPYHPGSSKYKDYEEGWDDEKAVLAQ